MPGLQLGPGANGGQPNDTWISGRNGAGADLNGQASREQMPNEQLAAAQGQAGVRPHFLLCCEVVSIGTFTEEHHQLSRHVINAHQGSAAWPCMPCVTF